ncbi:UDP-2,3-diacylglucosamine diphosphatase [Porphyromonas canoris]|uniref:UDP-2,3-diacylglucosamine diphosphatase n=1 Tax=Porphyromonas canoris TaxID=36875 RepID=UPI00068C12A1|nr:UDP-2,3-diacylglucosamine diphosphatase [Porphyromonas canoris]
MTDSGITSYSIPSGKAVYFFSDVHLGSPFHKDPVALERRLVQWLKSIEQDACMLVMLGDIFDYWFEYRDVVPRGFTRFLGQIARMSDLGIEIHFFTGNHDIWSFGYLEQELGVKLHTSSWECLIEGKRFLMAHGDEYDYRSKGFRVIRSVFHNKFCQKLYASIHPRWTVGLAHSWSNYSRRKGVEKRYGDDADFVDEQNNYLISWTKKYLTEAKESHQKPDFFIFGHLHMLVDLMIPEQKRVVILGDWIKFHSYAKWDGKQFSLDIYEEDEK